MAQIMEFLLNLLLLRGKLLTSTAAETIHEAIKKCLQLKNKISSEYATTSQVITPFENMLEYLNYSASQYRCEGENFMVANETHYDDMYDYFINLKSEEVNQNFKQLVGNTEPIEQGPQKVATEELVPPRNLGTPQWNRYEDDKKTGQKKVLKEDLLVGNIYAIFKSQELLFKNIMKLIDILESSKILTTDTKLEKIKKKLIACTDILSNSPRTQLSTIINNIIEEEITRCRFRHGESKTSAEISLKSPQPEGIAAALDTSHKEEVLQKSMPPTKQNQIEKINVDLPQDQNNSQVQLHPQEVLNGLKPVESEIDRTKNYETILKKIYVDVENSKKLIEVTEEHFNKFENSLWHSLTTTKFLSLKDDYLDAVRCAFRNKKHFQSTEIAILNKVKQESGGDQYQKYLLDKFKRNEIVKQENRKIEVGGKSSANTTDGRNPFVALGYQPNKQPEFKVTKNETNIIEENKVESKTTTGDIAGKNNQSKEKESTSSVDNNNLKQQDPKISSTVVKGQDVKSAGTETKQPSSESENKYEFKTEHQNINTIISGENLKNFIPSNSKDVFIAVLENKDNKVVESRQKFHLVLNDRGTNTIINSFMLIDSSHNAPGKNAVNVQESKSLTNPPKNDTDTNKKMRNEKKSNKEHSVSFRKAVSHNQLPSTTSPSGRTLKKELNQKIPRDQTSPDHSEEKPFEKRRTEPNNWKKVLQNISKNADSTIIIDVKEKDKLSIGMEEKSELAKILEKHSRTSVLNNQYAKLSMKNVEKEIQKNILEKQAKKESKIELSQTIIGEDTKLQSVVSDSGKITVDVDKEWHDRKGYGAAVSLPDLKNQSECIKMNEKAFKEFETAIRNVKIIVEKPSKAIKTTTKNKKFKFDDTSKKSMSTQQTVNKKLMQGDAVKDSIQVKETRHDLYKQIKKQTAKPTLPSERTFLKVPSKASQDTQESGKKKCQLEDDKKPPEPTRTCEKEKPNPNMRRTTKNAMKRQQVLTILPNVVKETKEKRKSQVSLVEIEGIKVAKSKQIKFEDKQQSLSKSEQVPVNTVKSRTARCCVRTFHNEQSRKIHCVQWETEDDAKIVNKLKS